MAEIKIFTYSTLGASNRWIQDSRLLRSEIRKEYGQSKSDRYQMKATCESGLKRTTQPTNGKKVSRQISSERLAHL